MISQIGVAAFILIVACSGCSKTDLSRPDLTVEGARQSLINWLNSNQDEGLKLSVATLRAASVERISSDHVKLNNWEVDLAKHTFSVVFAGDNWLHSISGEFIYDGNSKTWVVARVLETRT